MSDDALSHWETIILGLFPFLARFRVASSGALEVKSATSRTELEGGGAAVARVGDMSGRLYRDATSGALYYSPSATADYVIVASAAGPPVNGATPGTAIVVATGSAKVSSG